MKMHPKRARLAVVTDAIVRSAMTRKPVTLTIERCGYDTPATLNMLGDVCSFLGEAEDDSLLVFTGGGKVNDDGSNEPAWEIRVEWTPMRKR